MNPFLLILAQLAGQIVSQEGPVIIADLESALNGALAPHNHTVTITPTAPAAPATPQS